MLRLAVMFLVIALIAGFLGFAGVANLLVGRCEILFVVFLILAVLSFVGHGFRRRAFWGSVNLRSKQYDANEARLFRRLRKQ